MLELFLIELEKTITIASLLWYIGPFRFYFLLVRLPYNQYLILDTRATKPWMRNLIAGDDIVPRYGFGLKICYLNCLDGLNLINWNGGIVPWLCWTKNLLVWFYEYKFGKCKWWYQVLKCLMKNMIFQPRSKFNKSKWWHVSEDSECEISYNMMQWDDRIVPVNHGCQIWYFTLHDSNFNEFRWWYFD
jgi:hypothetical protein